MKHFLALPLFSLLTGASLGSLALAGPQGLPLPTTLEDFVQPGTQPGGIQDPILPSDACSGCHAFSTPEQEPYTHWAASMMGQATRDPVFLAALAIAEQDADFAGDLCLRCHAPGAWLAGRSVPTDGSGLDPAQGDLDGVTCNFCHRLVDPVYEAGVSPPEDVAVLAQVPQVPTDPHSGQYVVDDKDRRRGPFDLGPNFFWHAWLQSGFHKESMLCGNCHDVSNPAFTRQPDGTYALNTLNQQHPTHDKYDEFPVERTFSEWKASQFAVEPLDMGGRFGGDQREVSTCQDCHMPKTTGTGCDPGFGPPVRPDLPKHDFNGANSWVLRAVLALDPTVPFGLNPQSVDASIARNEDMLRRAADLVAFPRGSDLVVRVVNQTGHKLPSGYPEGRRMWLEVRFEDDQGNVLAHHGAYDRQTATLDSASTTVFETKLGMDAAVAAATGLPAGESFHFVLNNVVLKDNRIPPRGYTAAGFDAVQAAPVGASYQEEQYWADSTFPIPAGAKRAFVTLHHQTTTREYIEFLRDTNTTNNAGQVAYDQWLRHGKSAPVRMAGVFVDLEAPLCPPPIVYGLAKTSSLGQRPVLTWSGIASVSGPGFSLELQDAVPGQYGVAFWSDSAASQPFQGGKLYLAPPLHRLPPFLTDAVGAASVPVPLPSAWIGTQKRFQLFYRDPADPTGYGLTAALAVDICP